MKIIKLIGLILSAFALVVLYQNCAKEIDLQQFTKDQSSRDSEAPVIIPVDENQSIAVGDSVLIAFSVTGTNLIYTWSKNEMPLSGAGSNPIYQIQNAQVEDSGTYKLCIENARGSSCAQTELTVNTAQPTPMPTPGVTPAPVSVSCVAANYGIDENVCAECSSQCQVIATACGGVSSGCPVGPPSCFFGPGAGGGEITVAQGQVQCPGGNGTFCYGTGGTVPIAQAACNTSCGAGAVAGSCAGAHCTQISVSPLLFRCTGWKR